MADVGSEPCHQVTAFSWKGNCRNLSHAMNFSGAKGEESRIPRCNAAEHCRSWFQDNSLVDLTMRLVNIPCIVSGGLMIPFRKV